MHTIPKLHRIALSLILALAALAAFGQEPYPNRPIRIIVSVPPGGSNDTLARIYGKELSTALGQPVVIENKPGGNTIIGTDAVAKAAPDGYTLHFVDSSYVLTPLLLPTPYDAVKDFVPIATTNRQLWVLTVSADLPVKDLKELVALAKAKPGEINFATAGSLGAQRLIGEQFGAGAGIDIRNVSYKGAAEMFADLLSNRVQMTFLQPLSVVQYAKNGKLKALAITGPTRSPALPQVPTFTEAGFPDGPPPGLGFVESYWGFVAPAGVPAAIVSKLAGTIDSILSLPSVSEQMTAQGMPPLKSTPESYRALMASDRTKYTIAIKAAKLAPDK